MEEKRKVSLTTCILTLVIIALVAVAGFMYTEMKKTEEKVAELNEKINSLEQTEEEGQTENEEKQEENKGVKGMFIEFADAKIEDEYSRSSVQKILYTIYQDWEKIEKIFIDYCNKYSEGMTRGDGVSWLEEECNYEQYVKNYDAEKLDTTLKPINSTVEFKLATLREVNYYKATKKGIKVPDNDATLTEEVKFQYEMSLYDEEESEYSRISSDEPYFGIKGILIMNGNNVSEEEYNNNSRAKKIKITINNEEVRIVELKDTNEPQLIDINYKQNHIKTPLDVKFEVLETYQGLDTSDVYITDIGFGAVSSINGAR